MDSQKNKTCCFTGHRNISSVNTAEIINQLDTIVKFLISKGVNCFIVGGALGFDTLVAEYLLKLKVQFKDIRLVEALPFRSYRSRWNSFQTAHAELLDQGMDEILYCSDIDSRDAYLVRDRYMVDHSEYCISYCNRKAGGTAYTVRYAISKGLTVLNTTSFDIFTL